MAGDSDEVRLVFDIYISTPLKEQTDEGEIYIIPCQGHYLNPEYFSEESPLEYQDKSRTNNISSCKDYIGKHAEVVIASPDTIVFLMMVQVYPSLPSGISFLTGKGNLKRHKPVQPVYNKLRHISASSILAFHDQIGSDMSGRFAGRTKEWYFRVFMACDDDILVITRGIRSVGRIRLPTMQVVHQRERASVVLVLQPRS